MHEYHEAIHIIEHACEEAAKQRKNKVTKINLVIGESSGYSADSIRMHFEDAVKGTICEGAEITARTVKTMLRCPNCHELFARRPFHFDCPHCGTDGVPSEVGKEMSIESVECE